MKTYVFPRQGSQKKGMGDYLFDKYSDVTDKAEQILGYSIVDSIRYLMGFENMRFEEIGPGNVL